MFGRSKTSTRLLFVGLAMGTAVGVGVAANSSMDLPDPTEQAVERPEGDPIVYVDKFAAGPGLSVDEAAERVAAGMDGSNILEVTSSRSPDDAGDSEVPWIAVTLGEPGSASGANVRRRWEAALALGGVTDLVRTNEEWGGDVIGGANVEIQSSTGQSVHEELTGGYVGAGQEFDAQTSELSDDEIRGQVQKALHGFGLKAAQIEVFHPLGPAIAVTIADPPTNKIEWTIDGLRDAILGDPRSLEGLLIEIDDSTGAPILVSGVAYRTGIGNLWFADGQDTRFNAVHG